MPYKIRRALFTVSDKSGIVELAQALVTSGAELVATGKTAKVLKEAGLSVTPIETISGSPEAFQGRMKTLSFPVCSGILYRRGDPSDEADLQRLEIAPIDCVVVNFYPFEAAAATPGISRQDLIEQIDIGGPTLVRAAAKNAPSVLVLTDPSQYDAVISELSETGQVSDTTSMACAGTAWRKIQAYDQAIAQSLNGQAGEHPSVGRRELRYGENPHQKGAIEFDANSPIAWEEPLTGAELSYNNILDLSACYHLASDLVALDPASTGVVIVKHNNPCGVAMVAKSTPEAQKAALMRAWEGDPVSAFGGVIVFTDSLQEDTATWLAEKFVELVAAPGLGKNSSSLLRMTSKRRNLKAVSIRRLGEVPKETVVTVPGGRLFQSADVGVGEKLTSFTKAKWPKEKERLAQFGIIVCRALKSNSLAIVRQLPEGPQLVGTGQGQPNRVEALERLAIPRAEAVLKATGGSMADCILVSDAFFPFRDTVDVAAAGGLRYIIQPGGSIKDGESVAACDERGMAMAFTGIRHFRH